MRWLARFTDPAYALMRIVAGFLFLFHGIQLVFGFHSEFPPPPWSQLWVGGIIELLGGLAVMVGYQTRFAAFLCSGTMAVAYCQYHWKLQMGTMIFPALNKGELSVLYCFIFLFIACRGGVMWCLDGK